MLRKEQYLTALKVLSALEENIKFSKGLYKRAIKTGDYSRSRDFFTALFNTILGVSSASMSRDVEQTGKYKTFCVSDGEVLVNVDLDDFSERCIDSTSEECIDFILENFYESLFCEGIDIPPWIPEGSFRKLFYKLYRLNKYSENQKKAFLLARKYITKNLSGIANSVKSALSSVFKSRLKPGYIYNFISYIPCRRHIPTDDGKDDLFCNSENFVSNFLNFNFKRSIHEQERIFAFR